MRTLGIDLSAQPRNTAACLVAWDDCRARIERVELRACDERLTDLRRRVDLTAIDSPFGWPDAFVEAMRAWAGHAPWPGADSKALRYRLTDRHVADTLKVYPLSVSSDRIAACAWRCAGLLSRWQITDRSGREGVAEVYPAAARVTFGLPAKPALAGAIHERCPWLDADDTAWDALETNDHAVDALVCALVGRAIAIGAVGEIPRADRPTAEREGWIQLPTGRLEDLV